MALRQIAIALLSGSVLGHPASLQCGDVRFSKGSTTQCMTLTIEDKSPETALAYGMHFQALPVESGSKVQLSMEVKKGPYDNSTGQDPYGIYFALLAQGGSPAVHGSFTQIPATVQHKDNATCTHQVYSGSDRALYENVDLIWTAGPSDCGEVTFTMLWGNGPGDSTAVPAPKDPFLHRTSIPVHIKECAEGAALASASSVLERILLPNEYADQGGRCMAGTMAGYYYQAPPNEQDTWVIHMDGGGGCSTKESCEKWAKKSNGKGSSANWPATRDPLKNKALGILSDDPNVNPDFHGAHHVQIPYCTADGHVGTVTKPTSAQWGWYFSGHLNFELIVQHIVDTIPAAKQAKRVLLTGNSAGGIGTIHNCDFLQDKLASLGVSAEVSCAPKAGWFVPGFTEDQEDSELPPSSWDNWSVGKTGGSEAGGFQLWQSYAHPDCLKAHSSSDAPKI